MTYRNNFFRNETKFQSKTVSRRTEWNEVSRKTEWNEEFLEENFQYGKTSVVSLMCCVPTT
jgi:hypothetical protein